MHKQLLIAVAGIGLFLGGCSLAPNYAPPEAPVPAQWPREETRVAPQSVSEKPAVEKLGWENFFADEKLQKVIRMALSNSRDLRLAALNVERVRALYGIQRAELFPAVNAVGSGAKQHLPADLSTTGQSATVEQYGVTVGITAWEIDFFGRIRSLKDQALQAYLATEQARRGAQITLVTEVARSYLALAADRAGLALARATLSNQQAAAELIRKSKANGLATELDLYRARTQVEAARGEVARYARLAAQDRNALDLLAGVPVPAELLPVALDSVAPPAEIEAGLSSTALFNRPDILAAEHQLKGAYAFIGAARAALFPRISLTAAAGTASGELSGLFKSGSDTWNFAPQIAMPIFDARAWAALRVSKADRKIALARYEKAIQTAFREVADALAVQGTLDRQVAAQKALVKAVARTCDLSTKRYQNGIDNYLGVLDAQRAHYAARQGLVGLRLAGLVNQVRLYAVLGGGAE